ncbi:hypothetical protein LCGC14_0497350 [marine sediment metagenome]|uniref:Uncharacterized protein n=1 Tax=marine sediment metagenome TaxID=412755 RepID=A0A0F9SNB9_9ZZZZ
MIEVYIKALPPYSVVIHGDAPGVDDIAHNLAHIYRHIVRGYPARWDLHGDAAGPIRNQQMLDEGKPDRVVAFHEDLANSKGTKDMIARARKEWIPVEVFDGSGKSSRQTELELRRSLD